MSDNRQLTTGEMRKYPGTCLSSVCGKYGKSCKGCVNEESLIEFTLWSGKHEAVVLDPIWSPNYYYATK